MVQPTPWPVSEQARDSVPGEHSALRLSLNIVAAADYSLHALYPDGPKDFDKLEDMQKYFCNRARQEGFKVQCNLK